MSYYPNEKGIIHTSNTSQVKLIKSEMEKYYPKNAARLNTSYA